MYGWDEMMLEQKYKNTEHYPNVDGNLFYCVNQPYRWLVLLDSIQLGTLSST